MGLPEDLDLIDRLIHQLHAEWDKFFSGLERRPPNETKTRLDNLIRQYAYQDIRSNADRFRYQSLATRYVTFSELWAKRLRAFEEGRAAGLHVTAALAHRAHVPAPTASGTAAQLAPTGFPIGAVAASAAPGRRPAATAPGEVRVQDPSRDKVAVRALFEQFLAARKASGESGAVKIESFEKLIGQQTTRILSEKGASAVDFRIETKDGKVSLKARPIR